MTKHNATKYQPIQGLLRPLRLAIDDYFTLPAFQLPVSYLTHCNNLFRKSTHVKDCPLELEDSLAKLISEDARTAMELDSIEKLLNG